jgi:hypothetical protein
MTFSFIFYSFGFFGFYRPTASLTQHLEGGNDRFSGSSRHYDFVPHDLIFFFVRQLFCRLFSGLVDYKVKPVVISTNLLAI